MARSPEDEDFLKRREALAPEAEPPEMLAPLVAEEEQKLLETPKVDMTPPPKAPPPEPKLHVDPYGPGADRAALEDALKARQNADITATFQDAGSLFNKAFGGHAGDLAAATRAHRDDSFNDVMRRRAMTDQDAAAAKRVREQELDAAMRDPGSDVSVRARDLFSGTTVGKALRERMGDRFESLSANQLPGARDIISSETDLLKAQAKASHTGPDESATALEALAQRAEEVIPGMGDKVRAFGGTNKGLGAARDYVHQQLGQKFSNEQGILNRTNTTAKNEDTNRVANEQKDLSYLKDLGNTVKPEIVQAAGAIKRLKSMVAEGEAKYGPGNIPGVGILSAALSGHPTTAALMEKFGLTSSDANRFREEANLINVLQRHEITGAAFSKQEASEIRQLMANITSGNATQRTLDRLEELVHTALNKAYASHPTVAGKFIKSMGPDAETEQFNLNSPAEPSPQMQSITPDVAKARGVNPAGFMPPPVVPKSEVREPSGKIAPAPPGSAEIPTAQEPPPQKPGKLTMQLPDGRFVYSDPSKVEWVKAKFPGSKPIKYVLKK